MSANGWQPIETAPKDEALWCWRADWRMQHVAWFTDGGWWMPIGPRGRVAIQAPTHWRPLPEPPE